MFPTIKSLNPKGLNKALPLIFLAGVASCAIFLTKSHFAKSAPLLYHGSQVNTAVEERQDLWWRDAASTVAQKHEVLGTAAYRPFRYAFFHGDRTLKEIALTFDDGPHPGKVQKLLALLDRLKVKATFFVVGKMAEKHPELVRMEAGDGMEIGDHTFSHVNLSKITEEGVEIEYLACKNLIRQITGKAPLFCRPPGGQATPTVREGAEKCGLITTMWSDDPKDYSNPGSDKIESDLLDKISNGGILLLHEGVEETMQVLPDIVADLRSEGYRIVTVGQLAKDSGRWPKPVTPMLLPAGRKPAPLERAY